MALEKLLNKLQPGQGQKTGNALLQRVNTHLLVHGSTLYGLESGRSVELSDQSASAIMSATSIATAATMLLQPSGANDETEHQILLLLPPTEFLATKVKLPGVESSAVRAALKLQAAEVIPAFEEPLSFAIDSDRPDLALWIPESRTQELYEAFREQKLFLAAVMPRNTIGLSSDRANDSRLIIDSDQTQKTAFTASGLTVTSWLSTAIEDLNQPVFAQEWQSRLQETAAGDSIEFSSGADYLLQELPEPEVHQYVFFPAAALAARHRVSKSRLRSTAAIAAAIVLVLSALPFTVQTLQLRSLQSQLVQAQEEAREARQNQTFVREFESQWGALTEFPRQDVPGTLLTLQQIISPSLLTAIEFEKGFVSIEGDSQDPQNLLELLEENTQFTEVDFARATNNTRYAIDMRLTSVNFPAYMDWYFPESE